MMPLVKVTEVPSPPPVADPALTFKVAVPLISKLPNETAPAWLVALVFVFIDD